MVTLTGSPSRSAVARALLDPCSEITIISTNLARRLGAITEVTSVVISGVSGRSRDHSKHKAHIYLQPPGGTGAIHLEAHCLHNLQLSTPASLVDEETTRYWQTFDLADPSFGSPRAVELLIGADLYSGLLRPELMRHKDLVAQNTILGWVILGRTATTRPISSATTYTTAASLPEPVWHDQLVSLLQRSVHRRFLRDSEFQRQYTNFMKEYIAMGHMRPLTDQELRREDRPTYYIPHHGVWQRGDGAPRLRVVFNASKSTSTGVSLNDILYAGPKLQTNLAHVLIRWRRHRIAFCADIRMMYRQIIVDPRDIDLQRIVWRSSEREPVVHYQLLTVTYGQSCSPYLSLRTMQQLGIEHSSTWPEAALVVSRDRFVDDILTGCDNLDQARTLRDQVTALLQTGGFPLRKWVANCPELLEDLAEESRLRPTWHHITHEGPIHELGIHWNPQADCFHLSTPATNRGCDSKRSILATIARLFDPCGWIAPTILLAKILIQNLWRLGVDWDESIPPSFTRRWEDFAHQLDHLRDLTIPRWLGSTSTSQVQLHTFSDASRRAMAFVIYARIQTDSHDTGVRLLAAKTKLSPMRSLKSSTKSAPRMTIPHLELRAALMAAQLLNSVAKELDIPVDQCFAWTDSEIVLHWLRSNEPTKNVLVDDYIEHIREIVPSTVWRHVPTESNPADLASRGVSLSLLLSQQIWWCGPSWLRDEPSIWPKTRLANVHAESFQPPPAVACCAILNCSPDHLQRSSNLGRLLRVTAYILRWRYRPSEVDQQQRSSWLTKQELDRAFLVCVRLSQRSWLSDEAQRIKNTDHSSTSPPMKGLGTFLDPQGILRVGGRLHRSTLSYAERHPPIIDGRCVLAGLIIS